MCSLAPLRRDPHSHMRYRGGSGPLPFICSVWERGAFTRLAHNIILLDEQGILRERAHVSPTADTHTHTHARAHTHTHTHAHTQCSLIGSRCFYGHRRSAGCVHLRRCESIFLSPTEKKIMGLCAIVGHAGSSFARLAAVRSSSL